MQQAPLRASGELQGSRTVATLVGCGLTGDNQIHRNQQSAQGLLEPHHFAVAIGPCGFHHQQVQIVGALKRSAGSRTEGDQPQGSGHGHEPSHHSINLVCGDGPGTLPKQRLLGQARSWSLGRGGGHGGACLAHGAKGCCPDTGSPGRRRGLTRRAAG